VIVPVDDGRCIACGPEAEGGLGMRFVAREDGDVEARLALPARFAGWRGIAHGGVVAMLLDEAMAYAAGARGVRGVTAELTLRFRDPVPTEAPLVVRGRVLWARRGVFGVAADVFGAGDGVERLLAHGEGRFVARGTVEPGDRLASGVADHG